jgi:hypothetical protein
MGDDWERVGRLAMILGALASLCIIATFLLEHVTVH